MHESASAIPDENLRRTVLEEGGIVEGFYNPADGSIHILADRMKSQADVQRVLRHEGMHWAFANVLKKEYQELLAGSIAKIPDDRLDELLAKYPNASDATIVEEYLAYEGQNNPQSTAWRNFVFETKLLLRKVFGDKVEFTDKDILAFLSKANRRLESNRNSQSRFEESNDVSSYKTRPGLRFSIDRNVSIQIVHGEAKAANFKEAEQWLRENLIGKPLEAPSLGISISISNNSASKLATSAQKSSSGKAHIAAVQTIPELLKVAVAETHEDRNQDWHIAAIHRLYAPLESEGHIFRVKMTVKEYREKRHNLYALEAVEIEAPASFKDKSLLEPADVLSGSHVVDAGLIKVSDFLP